MSCLETWLWFGSPIGAAGQHSHIGAHLLLECRPSFTSCFLGMSHQYHSSSICTCLYSIYICALYQGPLRGELCKKNGDLTVQDVYSSGLEKILLVLVTHFVVQVQGFYSTKNKKINKIHSYYIEDLYLKISKFLEILSLQETIKFVKRPTNIMDLIKRPKNLFVIIFE